MPGRFGVRVLTIDAAHRILGVDPGADRDAVRDAFRRRMRELHPDVAGDTGPAGQAMARDVIEAYRRLCEPTTGTRTEPPASAPSHGEHLPDADPIRQNPSPRLVQLAMASMLVFGTAVFVLFFLVAFSQSGR